MKRKYPVGAEIIPGKGVHFRVWAPDHKTVSISLNIDNEWVTFKMRKERQGYFSVLVPKASKGTLYNFHFPKQKDTYTDPASRYQPQGPLGPSCVTDPSFHWTDKTWKGLKIEGQIIY